MYYYIINYKLRFNYWDSDQIAILKSPVELNKVKAKQKIYDMLINSNKSFGVGLNVKIIDITPIDNASFVLISADKSSESTYIATKDPGLVICASCD